MKRHIPDFGEFINERFNLRDITQLKKTVNPKYTAVILDEYGNLETPTGKEVITDLNFVKDLFQDKDIKLIYPIFKLIVDNKKYLKNYDYYENVDKGPVMYKHYLEIYIDKTTRLLKNKKIIIRKNSTLNSQINLINRELTKRNPITRDTLFVSELYKLLGDTNIKYLSVFYTILINSGPDKFDIIVRVIQNLNTLNVDFGTIPGDIEGFETIEELIEFNKNTKLDVVVKQLLLNNMYYKESTNKQDVFNYVKNLLIDENVGMKTNYLIDPVFYVKTQKLLAIDTFDQLAES